MAIAVELRRGVDLGIGFSESRGAEGEEEESTTRYARHVPRPDLAERSVLAVGDV